MTITDSKNRTFKIIGIYNDTAFSGVAVLKIDNSKIEYIDLYSRKKYCRKVYWNNSGEPFFIYNNSRLYIIEIARV